MAVSLAVVTSQWIWDICIHCNVEVCCFDCPRWATQPQWGVSQTTAESRPQWVVQSRTTVADSVIGPKMFSGTETASQSEEWRHLIVHHSIDIRTVGRGATATERLVHLSPDEAVYKRRQLGCRQGGRAKQRQLLAQSVTGGPRRPPSRHQRAGLPPLRPQRPRRAGPSYLRGTVMCQRDMLGRRQRPYPRCRVGDGQTTSIWTLIQIGLGPNSRSCHRC